MKIPRRPCVKCKRRFKLLTKKGECYYCNPKQHEADYFVTPVRNRS